MKRSDNKKRFMNRMHDGDIRHLKRYLWLLAPLFMLLASLLLIRQTRTREPKSHYDVMIDAAERADAAFQAIREERLLRGHAISPIDDPNRTGLVGDSYTEITTTLGSLPSKRSAANPNIAAMIVDMLTQCGVKAGDPVAVNFSGSFPGLNASVLCALDAMGAKGIVISSVGASTYGANLPDFTWLDMEEALLRRGLIANHSEWFSMGGAGDIGKEMPNDVKDAIAARQTDRGLSWLYYEDLSENLAARRAVYADKSLEAGYEQPVCFINAGGNLLSFGGGSGMVSAANGILRPASAPLLKEGARGNGLSVNAGTGGLIPFYLEQGVPVIHLLNMKSLLPAYGLPFDPSPMPKAGEGEIYMEWRYNKVLAFSLLAACAVVFSFAARRLPRRKIPL